MTNHPKFTESHDSAARSVGYEGAREIRKENMATLSLEIIRYCASEVERQQDSPVHVGHMCTAWLEAMSWKAEILTCGRIKQLGALVSPSKNFGDWRGCGVRVGSHIAPDPREVPELMERWLANLINVEPAEAYKEFQTIHPFRDGNGRVGKIIFNFLSKTMDEPIMPPNFFGCVNY